VPTAVLTRQFYRHAKSVRTGTDGKPHYLHTKPGAVGLNYAPKVLLVSRTSRRSVPRFSSSMFTAWSIPDDFNALCSFTSRTGMFSRPASSAGQKSSSSPVRIFPVLVFILAARMFSLKMCWADIRALSGNVRFLSMSWMSFMSPTIYMNTNKRQIPHFLLTHVTSSVILVDNL